MSEETPIEDTAMSYDEWRSAGYHVVKGEKSQMRDALGVPQFTADQVSRNCKRDALCDARIPPRRTVREIRESYHGANHGLDRSPDRRPYYREHEVPPGAYDPRMLPQQDHMDALMSMMNPNHRAMRSLERHLDSVFEKHHGGCFDEEDF